VRKYNSRHGRLKLGQQFLIVQLFFQELPSCPFVNMADLREQHNGSPMPGVAHNDDPALDIAREHDHPHVHHSARAAHPDNIVYTTGTTDEKTSKLLSPSALDSHVHHRHTADEKHDLEKAGGYDYEVEKATRSSSDPEMEAEKKPWYSPSVLYRRYRLPVHIFIGALFTG
jgi:CNT family concentrative nucleoside transporter